MNLSLFNVRHILFNCILFALPLIIGSQHLPPGVNPAHYQQTNQQHMPQMQHVPIQQQMPQQQMHGMPQQQMHGIPQQQMHGVPQQQMHGVPQQQMHGVPQQHGIPQQQMHHGHHGGQPQVLNVANIQHEKEHIKEHLAVPNLDTSKMTEQELQFHYFKMHDADNNNKLDGCELIKSLIHWHEQGHHDAETGQKTGGGEKLFKDEELSGLIDPILAMDDANHDGFIDYPEFVQAQQKAAAASGQPSK